jgi:DNA-directed RNA polymerase specialized sigma24 family protein
LKPEYREAVYFADIEELNYKEIGKIMNKTENGIKVLIHRARKNLEKIVREEAVKYEG